MPKIKKSGTKVNENDYKPKSFINRIEKYKQSCELAVVKPKNKTKKAAQATPASDEPKIEDQISEVLEDKVEFGEVAMEPPKLKVRPKQVFKKTLPLSEARILEAEREKVIQAYKEYKKRRNNKLK